VRSQHSTHQNKSKAFFEASPESHCLWREKSRFQSKKNSSIAMQLNVDVFIFQKICWNNLVTSWRKLSCLVFSSMKQQVFQKRCKLILCYRFANQETKTVGELCCLDVGVCSISQAIFAKFNQFIEKHDFNWMKYKAVATNGAAAMQGTTNGASCPKNQKHFPWLCFKLFFRDLSVIDRSCFEMSKKK